MSTRSHPHKTSVASGILSLVATLSACAGEGSGPAGPTGPTGELRVQLAAMTLPGIGDACVDLEVRNGPGRTGELVWARGTPGLNGGSGDAGAVCASRFGSTAPSGGGDLGVAFVGSCDASGQEDPSDAANERTNSVTLWFDALYGTTGAYLSPTGENAWQNPCPNGCTIDVLCEENADAAVTYDLTVLRDAGQGFFDIIVDIEDIFCSSKVDNCYADGRRIMLLPDGPEGGDGRAWTTNFGLTCSAGVGEADTLLLFGPIVVDCGVAEFTLDPTTADGDIVVATDGDHSLTYSVFRGAEELPCADGAPCNRVFLNFAISLDDLSDIGACDLSFSATANDGNEGFAAGRPVGLGVSYPYIDVALPLTPASCQTSGLNDGSGRVETVYHGNLPGFPPLVPMCHQFNGETAAVIPGACE